MWKEKRGKGFEQSCQKLYSRRYPDTNHPGLLLQPYQVKSKDTARACNFVRMPLMNWIRLWKNLSNSEFWYVSFQEVNNYSQTADNEKKQPVKHKVVEMGLNKAPFGRDGYSGGRSSPGAGLGYRQGRGSALPGWRRWKFQAGRMEIVTGDGRG